MRSVTGPLTVKPVCRVSPRSESEGLESLTVAEPPQRRPILRVMMLITPPMASEPYSDDIGPRTTSMRSIISGEIQSRSCWPRSSR